MTHEEFRDWLDNPITKQYFAALETQRDEAINLMINWHPATQTPECYLHRYAGSACAFEAAINVQYDDIGGENES